MAAALALSAPAVAAAGVRPSEAAAFVGKMVTVEGLVQQVACSPRACLLSFESGWSGLIVSIPGEDLARFPDPKKTFERRNVRVRGVVEERDGRLRMELAGSSRIEVVGDAGGGSRVLSAEEKPPRATTEPAAGAPPTTEVRVRDQASDAGRLGAIVRELGDEAGVSASRGEGGAPRAAVRGLRERVAVQSQTIRDLESELDDVRGRLQDLEAVDRRPASEAAGVPHLEPWVVPARRGLAEPRPRTGWSAARLLRELGPPREVASVTRDRELWRYDGNKAVTVARGRVESSTGF